LGKIRENPTPTWRGYVDIDKTVRGEERESRILVIVDLFVMKKDGKRERQRFDCLTLELGPPSKDWKEGQQGEEQG